MIKEILNRHLFRPVWYSIIINPYFIIRRGLFKKIKQFAKSDFSNKNILDVGCGIKPYQSLFNAASYIGIDIEGGGHKDRDKLPDKFFDGTTIPYPDNSFDAVICTEVLEHTPDPEKLLSEIKRVLKTGGDFYMTMPFVWYEHEIPFDFNRFTRYKIKSIFEKTGLNIIKLEENPGVFRVCGQLISAFTFERLFVKNKPLKMLVAIVLCFPIQLIFICLDSIFRNHWLSLNYIVTAKK